MNDLQLVQQDGEMLADSRDIAKKLGIQHETLMKNINSYVDEFRSFGILRFEIGEIKGRGQPEKYVLLNEDQAHFAGTVSKNTKEVVAYKAWLIRNFQTARKIINRELTPIEMAERFIIAEKKKLELQRLVDNQNKNILILEHKNEALIESDQIVKQFMSCDGLLSFEEVAQTTRTRLKHFNKILQGVVRKGDGNVYANLVASGKVVVKILNENNRIQTKSFFTPGGAVWFYKKYIRGNRDDIRIKINDLDM